ncbi:MAG: alpha/beta hydrolase [Salinisphaeraceae bacterium]|nr:alpha/beta hydrolase [Salinisphaeraceae bacterium]
MMKAIMRRVVRYTLKPILNPRFSVKWQRRLLAPVGPTQPRARGSSYDAVNMNGVPGRRIACQTSTQRAVLFLHGGAYVIGNAASHRGLMSHIAKAAEVTVFAPEYRMAPEHPHPAALDDSLAAYQWLLDNGFSANDIFIAGDSAGGGLALLMALALRERNMPQPAGLILLSPWVDLSQSCDSIQRNASIDPMINPAWGAWAARLYAPGYDLKDPAVSPLFAELKELPNMLIQVGTDEVMLDEAIAFADKAKAAGVNVDIQIEEGMWHDFQLHTTLLKESMDAIGRMADFIKAN